MQGYGPVQNIFAVILSILPIIQNSHSVSFYLMNYGFQNSKVTIRIKILITKNTC